MRFGVEKYDECIGLSFSFSEQTFLPEPKQRINPHQTKSQSLIL